MNWLPVSRTLAVAHRGFSSRAPENTLVAFEEALEAGATHVECDVHASADGTPYVIHDAEVNRTTGATGRVSELTNAELDALDAGHWKADAYAGEPIPRLEALLAFLRGRGALALEIKAKKIEAEVVDAIAATEFPLSALTVFSFDFDTLTTIRELDRDLHCTYLIDRVSDDNEWTARVVRTRDAGFEAIGPANSLIDERRVEVAHAAGLSVFVWTVDDAERMKELSGFGVDAIMTNDVTTGLDTLGR